MSYRTRGVLPVPVPAVRFLPLPPPELVAIPHCGELSLAARPFVREGERVFLGQRLADGAEGCEPVFASVSGRVRTLTQTHIVVENDGLDERRPDGSACATADGLSPAALRELFRELGALPPVGRIVVVNALVPEPGMDDGLFCREYERVFSGLRLYLRAYEPARAVVAVGRRQQTARRLAEQCGFAPALLAGRYPQAMEPLLLESLFGGRVPEGCAVLRPETLCALSGAVYEGLPPVFQTVSLSAPDKPWNRLLRAPVGTPVEHLLRAAGEAWPVTLCGGVMTGRPLPARRTPVTRGLRQLTCLEAQEPLRPSPCLRCSRCAGVCPAGLFPALLRQSAQRKLRLRARELCLRCGLCAWVCPAGLPCWYQSGRKEAAHDVGAVSAAG